MTCDNDSLQILFGSWNLDEEYKVPIGLKSQQFKAFDDE
jgi:hypothetical protein